MIYESILGTVLVYIVLWILFYAINISFKPFNYISNTVKDINLNDMYFSSVANNMVDTNIIVINIEDINRKGIADLLNKISDANPRVIGLDVFFSIHNKTEHDEYVKNTLHRLRDKLVIAVNYDKEGNLDQNFWQFDHTYNIGHAGILTNEQNTSVVREFNKKIISQDREVWSFASKIAKKYDIERFNILKKRKFDNEKINYIGNTQAFRSINHSDLMNFSKSDLELLYDKIVLVGFFGGKTKSTDDLKDMYYTPVGFEISANRNPDMYGLIIHANILSMILNDKYINQASNVFVYIISFIITFIHVWFFTYFFVKKHLYYHVFAKLMQLISFSLILWIIFVLFSQYNYFFPSKYLLLPVILSVDVLYLYEALAIFFGKTIKRNSVSIYLDKH